MIRARGERPIRLPLVPVGALTTMTLDAARARAEARAAEPIALASVRTVARVFE